MIDLEDNNQDGLFLEGCHNGGLEWAGRVAKIKGDRVGQGEFF
jgi:hypothetical protein